MKKWSKIVKNIESYKDINSLFNYSVNIRISIIDILSQANVIVVFDNGVVFEKLLDVKLWQKWESIEHFTEDTGNKLEELNESPKLLDILKYEINDFRVSEIQKVYISEESELFNKILDGYKKIL